jgi:hypothetical protein
MRLRVVARRLDADGPMTASAAMDARGRFSVEGLLPGEYEVAVSLMIVTPPSPGIPPPPSQIPPRTLAKQNVTVSNGAETQVTLTVDLSAKDKDGEK